MNHTAYGECHGPPKILHFNGDHSTDERRHKIKELDLEIARLKANHGEWSHKHSAFKKTFFKTMSNVNDIAMKYKVIIIEYYLNWLILW